MRGDDEIPAPPPGFVLNEVQGPFTVHNGPIFHRPAAEGENEFVQALYVAPRHTNGLALLHGGMLATFLDNTLGGAVRLATGQPSVTVHMSIDYMRMARQGEWVIAKGRVAQVSGRTVFAEVQAYIGEVAIGRATGVFQLMNARA
jgi:uncharacterized protein (TIGR00369 family)